MKKILLSLISCSLILSGCPSDEGDEVEVPKNTTSNNEKTESKNTEINSIKDYNPKVGKYGGKRTITSFSPPKTFNYYLAAETSSTDILIQLYVGLLTTDPKNPDKVIPELAESYEVKDDKVTYIVKLKKNLKWSDGQPITADDVVFTYNDIINNTDIPSNSRDGMLVDNKFPQVTKVDDYTIKFVTAKPFVPFLKNSLGTGIMPKHILANLVKKDKNGKIPFNQWGSLNSDPKSIVCNGPFKIKEYVPGQRVILERNPYFWRKDKEGNQLPYVDQYVVEIVKDQAVETIKFKALESDSITVQPQDFQTLKSEQEKLNFTIHNLGPNTGTLFIMFNLSTAKNEKGEQIVNPIKSRWFRNVKFRQALAHAIDKESIIRSVYNGLAKPQWSDISVQNPFFNPNVRTYPYDLKKAEEILKEAGFKKNDKGELLDDKGNRVEFDLVTNVGNTMRDAACGIIRADWEKLGIKVNYRPIQFNVMVQQIDETLDWEAMMIGLTGSASEPHSGINVWRLDGRMHMFNMGNANQNPIWKGRETTYEPWEKEVLDLFEKASQEFDPVKRKALYYKSQEIVSENLPFLYTVNSLALVAVRNNIGNIYPTIHGGSGLNMINWNSYEHYILTP
ncbi:MAG: peptide ABC transporter substrate-binding protein [Candidatus Sericytochromatia bacterium]|nr:MAG: peptide ABC transporter substrate-binding protein [Candidatus Sericytochromatia bacterium]